LNHKHKALRLMKEVSDNGFTGTREFSKRYYEESGKDRLLHYMDVHMNYYLDLKKGVTEELEKIIERERKKPLKSREKKKYGGILRKIIEEKGLAEVVKTHMKL